jgi:hypothetical protein
MHTDEVAPFFFSVRPRHCDCDAEHDEPSSCQSDSVLSFPMQHKLSVGVLLSALSDILPLNRHAQALKSFAFNLNAYKVAQLEAYQQRIGTLSVFLFA